MKHLILKIGLKNCCFVTGHGEGHERVRGKRQERVRVKRDSAVRNFMGYFVWQVDEYASWVFLCSHLPRILLLNM